MRTTLTAAVAVAAMALSACGGSDRQESKNNKSAGGAAKSDKSSTVKSAEAARQVIVDYGQKFKNGDAEGACDLLTDEYQKQQVTDAAEFSDGKPPTDCEGAMKAGQVMAKAFGYDPSKSEISKATVDGDTATVVESAGEPFDDTQYTLVWQDDQWLISEDASAKEAAADTDRWLANWCNVSPGMTVKEADALMGNHTGEFLGDDQPNPQVEWSAGGFSFTAFLDTNEKIRQLDTNETNLGAEDKAKLKCESTRR